MSIANGEIEPVMFKLVCASHKPSELAKKFKCKVTSFPGSEHQFGWYVPNARRAAGVKAIAMSP
jgi:hypothetical protein